MKLGPLIFQDDVARLASDVKSAQVGNDRLECMLKTKLLELNEAKSCFLVFGNKKKRNELAKELEQSPLKLCGENMKHEKEAKYLGDTLSEAGLANSVTATIMKRKGMVSRATYEARCVIDDCRSNLIGGMAVGFEIWEIAVLPMLLNNAECWLDISAETMNILEKMQLQYLKTLLAVGSGCPNPLLLSETGMLLMEYRILQKKLLFLHHIVHLPENALAKEILNIQIDLGLPGLFKECKAFLICFGIHDLKIYTKNQFKRIVKEKIRFMNKEKIIEQIKEKGYKKIDTETMHDDTFLLKSYFKDLKVEDARLKFKLVSSMTPTVQMNFQSEKSYTANMWTCSGCKANRDTQLHILNCEAYEHIRTNRDMTNDADLVDYFREIIDLRVAQA